MVWFIIIIIIIWIPPPYLQFGQPDIVREDKDGKNGVFEEEEEEKEATNTLLTLPSSEMYSSASIT